MGVTSPGAHVGPHLANYTRGWASEQCHTAIQGALQAWVIDLDLEALTYL